MADYNNDGQATLGVGSTLSPTLMQILVSDDIQPGSSPSYELAKNIFAYHPLGAKLAEEPITRAQSQKREISIPGAPEGELIAAFDKEWDETGHIGADKLIHNTMKTSRIYGVASIAVGAKNLSTTSPLQMDKVAGLDLYYNVLDPLNTAGSLVLDQNPNAADYQKPTYISVGSMKYHSSRACIVMNEQPIYIEWSNSAFGFVGRSVYQRCLYPLKSYIQTMITDQAVAEKAALLIAKLKSPGSVIDQRARSFFGFKREAIKGAKTGNVVSIGIDESVESVDLKNLKDAAEFSRNNILKNIAASANMPASMINLETLAEGFGEGTEDAKTIAAFIDTVRMEMRPLYKFFDEIVMRRAWNEEFYASMQRKYPETYRDMPYETAFYGWKNAFKATWPNLLTEPDSEKVKTDDVIMKAAIACFEVLAPTLDPDNKATAALWLADVMNSRKLMFSEHLDLDGEAIANYVPPTPIEEPREPKPFSSEA